MSITSSRRIRRVRLLIGVVARAHHRAAGRVREAHFRGLGLEHAKHVRMRIATHRQMMVGGCEVLADCQHVDVMRAQVAHHLQISSSVSPSPTIRPLLVGTPGTRRLNSASSVSECW